jgi:hypothetical protein
MSFLIFFTSDLDRSGSSSEDSEEVVVVSGSLSSKASFSSFSSLGGSVSLDEGLLVQKLNYRGANHIDLY